MTGTDTGVGKTVVAAAICAALAARGQKVAAFKPVVTGVGGQPPAGWPADHELLAAAADGGQTSGDVAPYTFREPVSPHFASQLEGRPVEPARIRAAAGSAASGADVLVCEGVGGLLVPLTPTYSVRDLAMELKLPVLVVARTGLGTINHSLLTVEAAWAAGLRLAGLVMSPWPARPEPIERSNRETLERLTGLPVSCLAPTTPRELAAAGDTLPIADWL